MGDDDGHELDGVGASAGGAGEERAGAGEGLEGAAAAFHEGFEGSGVGENGEKIFEDEIDEVQLVFQVVGADGVRDGEGRIAAAVVAQDDLKGRKLVVELAMGGFGAALDVGEGFVRVGEIREVAGEFVHSGGEGDDVEAVAEEAGGTGRAVEGRLGFVFAGVERGCGNEKSDEERAKERHRRGGITRGKERTKKSYLSFVKFPRDDSNLSVSPGRACMHRDGARRARTSRELDTGEPLLRPERPHSFDIVHRFALPKLLKW
jgi:hypothetical protein